MISPNKDAVKTFETFDEKYVSPDDLKARMRDSGFSGEEAEAAVAEALADGRLQQSPMGSLYRPA